MNRKNGTDYILEKAGYITDGQHAVERAGYVWPDNQDATNGHGFISRETTIGEETT